MDTDQRASSVFSLGFGEDPLAPPRGIFGDYGASHARRSIALGLNGSKRADRQKNEWGSIVSMSDEDESLEGEESCQFETAPELSAFIKPETTENNDEEINDEIRNCIELAAAALQLYDLQINRIPDVPLLCEHCTHITTLDLSYNFLQELPPEIGNLILVEKLYLRSNQLVALPSELSKMTHLKEFYGEQNQLTSIPDSFREMAELNIVCLDWNDLEEFPAMLCAIKGLSELYLIENPNITSLPLKELENVTMLVLSLDNVPSIVAQANKEDFLHNVTINYNKVFPDRIIPGLFLGSLRSAQSIRVYEELNIQYLATVGRELQTVLGPGMKQIQMMVDDIPNTDITSVFEEVHTLIDEALSNNVSILVHCFKGQSRSASCVLSYVIKKFKWSYDQAEQFVRDRSPRISPNPSFVSMLRQYAETIAME